MPKVSSDKAKIDWFLSHAVEKVYPSEKDLREKLTKGERITVYHGIDPTGPTLHLGHTIPLRKLAELQQMGHKIILVIGDFTAMIGDPSDKSATRKQLTREEVLENCKNYKKQLEMVLDFKGSNPVEMRFNSEWLAKMSFADVVELASHFTVQQMLERDMFEKRMEEKKPIHLHEFFYPLMQGYDSVALDTDFEIGGNDQTFNMLAGRTLLREMKKKEKFVLTTKLLVDSTGKKMGKTEGNMLMLSDSPEDMYGKVMSWTDSMILPGFNIVTDATDKDVKEIEKKMEKGENPMVFKRLLAQRIVQMLRGEDAAREAAENFTLVHQEKKTPGVTAQFALTKGEEVDLLHVVAVRFSQRKGSKTEARQLLKQGSIKVNDKTETNPSYRIKVGDVINKTRFFLKVTDSDDHIVV